MLGKQQQFVTNIVRLVKEVSQFGGSRSRKVCKIMTVKCFSMWNCFIWGCMLDCWDINLEVHCWSPYQQVFQAHLSWNNIIHFVRLLPNGVLVFLCSTVLFLFSLIFYFVWRGIKCHQPSEQPFVWCMTGQVHFHLRSNQTNYICFTVIPCLICVIVLKWQ